MGQPSGKLAEYQSWRNTKAKEIREIPEEGTGVYLVYRRTPTGCQVIYVGEGRIKDRLCCHRRDERLAAYESRSELYVVWAEMPKATAVQVERHLTDTFAPPFGSRRYVRATRVNLPFRNWSRFS
jgi:hypothetical protein